LRCSPAEFNRFVRMRTKPGIQRGLLRAAILHVRSGRAASRSSLAAALGLAPSTAGLYVDRLISAGLMSEAGLERGSVGRPKRILSTPCGAGWFAGVEFNAERVQVVRIDFAGERIGANVKHLPDDVDAETVLRSIHAAIALLAKGTKEPLLAIGVGAPGIVDPAKGVSEHYPLIADWGRVPIGELVGRKFDVPVTVENNLRAIAHAERWFGGGRTLEDYVILGPRSGFGVALVQGGRVLRGAHHAAGEIGYLRGVLNQGDSELQTRLSASAVWRRLAGVGERARLPEDLRARLATMADSTGEAWDGVVDDYAQVIGCLQLLVDTGVFFLHGPLTALGTRFCTAVDGAARARYPSLADETFQIVPSSLGDDAGALGAASLAMESWAPEEQ
jgi:predicted NBD/HSP70 family sugar kinase